MAGRNAGERLLLGGLGLAAFAGLSVGAVAAWTLHKIHGRKKRDLLDDYFITPFELKVPHEEVRFVTQDHLVLKGWWFSNDGSDRTIVALTGQQGRKDDLIGIGTGLWRAGFNVLLFDYRGRGESEDSRPSIGYYEQSDVQAALDYAMKRTVDREGTCRPALLGYSMGAVLALYLASVRPEIEAVVADCPFANLNDLVGAKLKERFIPGWMMPLIDYLNRAFFGYSLNEVNPLAWISRISPRPLLLIHAEKDRIIPVEDSLRLYDA
ncbi:MAG: alpha/beta fold hydrolase, partial [Leptospiraceae bacterium]|nr:alpha/beta fold hydrolase [Leptospiraceae bacterium]